MGLRESGGCGEERKKGAPGSPLINTLLCAKCCEKESRIEYSPCPELICKQGDKM